MAFQRHRSRWRHLAADGSTLRVLRVFAVQRRPEGRLSDRHCGKTADAIETLDAADARAARAHLSPVTARRRALLSLQVRLLAAWKLKQPTRAEKLFAALAAESMKVALRRADLSVLDWGQGVLSLARGDARSAVEAMKKCSEFDTVCRFMLVTARRAAGDKAGAAETLARLKASPRRDGAYLYFWATMK